MSAFDKMLAELLSLPTAPFFELAVSRYVRAALSRIGVPYSMDPHGNILAHLRRGSRRLTPLALVAHMDHPGFLIEKKSSGRTVVARVLGGLGEDLTGRRIRFFSVPELSGVISGIAKRGAAGKTTHVHVRLSAPAPAGTFGAWDVLVFRRTARRIYARAIDDVCGVAVMLEVLKRLKSWRGGPLNLYCCFTRAEEVGFIGAAALARSGILPKHTRVISIEMSRALPGKAEQGKGFVLRIGDRASVFDPRTVEFLTRVAQKIQSAGRAFRFQTAILDGGVCEATLFNAMGYHAAGVALPLGNYHNRTPRGGVAPEYIDIRDLETLIKFLSTAPKWMGKFEPDQKNLRRRLERNFNRWKRFL